MLMMLTGLIGIFLTVGLFFNVRHKNSLLSPCTHDRINANMAQVFLQVWCSSKMLWVNSIHAAFIILSPRNPQQHKTSFKFTETCLDLAAGMLPPPHEDKAVENGRMDVLI